MPRLFWNLKMPIILRNLLLYLKAIGNLRREYGRGFRGRCNLVMAVKDELVPMKRLRKG
jgi:hypothetical protein